MPQITFRALDNGNFEKFDERARIDRRTRTLLTQALGCAVLGGLNGEEKNAELEELLAEVGVAIETTEDSPSTARH